MAGNTINIAVLADTSRFTKAMQSLGQATAAIGRAVVAGLAVIGAAATKLVFSASEVEQAWGAVEQIFGEQTAALKQWSMDAAIALGMSEKAYSQLAVGLGNALKGYGVAGQELADKTNALLTRSADIAAMYGGTAEEVAAAITSAYRGEYDAVQRYVPTINAAAVQKEMQLKNISQAQAVFNLLMEGSADAEGQAAREAKTFAGVLERLKAVITNIGTGIGTALLPGFAAAGSAALRFIGAFTKTEAFQGFMSLIEQASKRVAEFFDALEFDPGAIDRVLGVLGGLAPVLAGILLPMSGLLSKLPLVGRAFQALTVFAGPLGVLVGVLGALLFVDPTKMQDAFTKLAEKLPTILTGLVTKAVEVITTLVPQLVATLTQNTPVFIQGVLSVVEAIAGVLPTLLPVIIQALVAMIPVLVNGAVQLFNGIVQGLLIALPIIVQAITDSMPTITQALIDALPLLTEAAITLFTALVDALPLILPPLLEAIIAIMPSVVEALLSLLPELLDAAIELFLALVEAVGEVLPQLLDALVDMLPELTRTLISMLPKLLEASIKLFLALVKAIPKVLPDVVDALVKMAPDLVQAIVSMTGEIARAGGELIKGLAQGLWDKRHIVKDKLLEIASGAVDAFKRFFGIESPSKVFRALGDNLLAGLELALGDTKGVVQAVEKVAGLVTGSWDASLSATGPVLNVSAQTGQGNTYYNFDGLSITVASAEDNALLQEFLTFIRRKSRAGMGLAV